MAGKGLGRLLPTDDRHLRRYGLTAATAPRTPTPVCLGINWYDSFDDPVAFDGAWWIGRGPWGTVRGGHEICVKPPALTDLPAWWRFYDQGEEGACVGFALSRMMSLLNRRRYDARRLYHRAQQLDEWAGEGYVGTTGRAGCDVLRLEGHWPLRGSRTLDCCPDDGILENRWAGSVEEIAHCLSPADQGRAVLEAGYVTLLNSWGEDYEHKVRLDLEGLSRLVLREGGDATVVTDRPGKGR